MLQWWLLPPRWLRGCARVCWLVQGSSLSGAGEVPRVVFVIVLLWGGIYNNVGSGSVLDSSSFWALAFGVDGARN